MGKTTDDLIHILQTTGSDRIGEALAGQADRLIAQQRPFAAYIRELLRQHGLTQNYVIEKAGFSIPYGYRLLSEERHTKQRDYILRFCIAAGLSLPEIQRLLQLYGMAPLYARIPRDAVLIAAVSDHITEIGEVDRLLQRNGMDKLLGSEGQVIPNPVY